MQTQTKALLSRALKTFVQAFVAFLVANLANVTNIATAKALAVAAFAAGISALTNVFVQPKEG